LFYSDSTENLIVTKKKYYGPWMQLIGIVEKLYEDVSDVLESNNIEYSGFDINKLSLYTDLNDDLELMLSNIKEKKLYSNRLSFEEIGHQIRNIAKKFHNDIHRSELLLVLAAYRHDDGLPLLDIFNKIEIESVDNYNLCCVPRNRTEFLQQLLGDGSFLGSFYKVYYIYMYIYTSIYI
jgi:hypothetical protein